MTSIQTSQVQLRDYQNQLINDIFQAWSQTPRVLAQLPTGGGKTVIFSAITDEFAKRGESVLVLAHREELITQAAAKLQAVTGQPVSIIKAGYPRTDSLIQVASVQTAVNRLGSINQPGLVIIDESHHATAKTYRQILSACEGAYVLGVTATPCRTDGSGFSDLFDQLVCGPTVSELIASGFLSPFKLFADPSPMVTGRSQAGDFLASDVAKKNNAVELAGNLVESYWQHAAHLGLGRCLVFAVNVSHSRAIAERYREFGISAMHLDGNTPEEVRKEALQKFAAGELKVITNCALFDEGLDLPGLEAIQVAKPTQSLGKWLQMCGRALRTSPGKEYAAIIDHTRNWQFHGQPTRPRVWTLDGVKQEREQLKRNPRTGEVKEELIVIEAQSELQAVAEEPLDPAWEAVWRDTLETQKSKGYKPTWLRYALEDLNPPLELWRRCAEYLGYKPGWAWHRWKDCQIKAS